MYAIFSYGSPRFAIGNLSVHFHRRNPAGQIIFQPKEEHLETLSGDTITVFKGYRALVRIKLWNLAPQDYQDHLTLLNIINQSRSHGAPILLQPRFSSGATPSFWVLPEKDIKYEEITNLNAGQGVELEFFTPALLSQLPLIVNTPRFLMLDSTHYLLLSAANNKLIIPYTNYQEADMSSEASFTQGD